MNARRRTSYKGMYVLREVLYSFKNAAAANKS